jgi:hypothetical protein
LPEPIKQAEFDVLITTDQNLRYQQNLVDRKLAIMVLPTTSWPKLQGHAARILAALNQMQSGSYSELLIEESA